MLKEKGVAALGLLVIMLLSASVYTMNRNASVAAQLETEEPECKILFNPDLVNAKVGDVFNVEVKVDDVKNFWGFEIGLAFNPDVVEYVGEQMPSWKFISGTHPRLAYLFWAAAIIPQNGEVELMTFTFKAKAVGSSALSLYVHKLATRIYWDAPHDYVGWPIPHLATEGSVSIS